MKLMRTIKTRSQYFSISLMNQSTFLVSTFQDRRPLRMVTMTGEENDFDLLPEREYDFNKSRATYIPTANTCVLTDAEDESITMFEVIGNCVIRNIVKDERIKRPTVMCVCPKGNVFVCSTHTGYVVQLSPSGRVIGSYQIPMRYSLSICVSKDGAKMAISNSIDGVTMIQMYELVDTDCVTKSIC